MSAIVDLLIAELDDEALNVLAMKLAPKLAGRLAQTTPTDDGWLSAREAATYLSVPISTVWKLCCAREIPFAQERPRARLYFKRSELDAWREGTWKR